MINIKHEIYDKTTCFIVGGGPSLKIFDWADLKNTNCIAINRAYEVLPDADIYFTDDDWWFEHRSNLYKHKGKKIKGTINRSLNDPHVEEYKLTGHTGLETIPGHLRHGNNSSYAALNLAYQLGFKTVYLLGLDMKWGIAGDSTTSHWHSGHKRIDKENGYKKMKTNFSTISVPLEQAGVQVYNVNPNDSLPMFTRLDFSQVFGDKYKVKEQEYFKSQNEKLIGDRIEQVLDAVGVKKAAQVYQRITKKPCNCGARKERLNNLHRRVLGKSQLVPPKIELVQPTHRPIKKK